MKPSRRIHLSWQTDRRGVGGVSGSTIRLGNTRSIVFPGQGSPRLLLHQCGRPSTTMNAVMVRLSMETKRPFIRVCACRHVSAPDHPGEGCRFLLPVRCPVSIQGSRTPVGVRGSAEVRASTGGPEPSVVRAERPLHPEHVALPDLSQPGDGSGTVVR